MGREPEVREGGTARPGPGWDGEGLERPGGGGAKASQLIREKGSPKQPPQDWGIL